MRMVAALLIVLALAGPALAQKLVVKPAPSTSAASKLGLRGAVDSTQPDAAPPPVIGLDGRPILAAPTPAPIAPAPAPAPVQNGGQCRLACAQAYYFCQSTDSPDECPSTWGQCRAACDAPSPTAKFPTTPAR